MCGLCGALCISGMQIDFFSRPQIELIALAEATGQRTFISRTSLDLAKNTATDVQFAEWLAVVKEALSLDLIGI